MEPSGIFRERKGSNVNLREEILQDAKSLIANLNQRMNPSAYDIAWMARLRDADGSPWWPDLLDWLLEHQHPDGSWGGQIEYYHDRIISTLVAMIALRENSSSPLIERAIKAAERYIWNHLHLLRRDPFELAGFELLLPTLIEEARSLRLDMPSHTCGYGEIQTAKLRLIPPDMLYSPYISTVHSLEFMGKVGDVDRIRGTKTSIGSVGNSPATTAYYLGLCQNQDSEALGYLTNVKINLTNISTVYPFETFEIVWALNNLLYTDIPVREFVDEHILQFLKNEIGPRGVGFDPTFPVTDGDTTSVCYRVLLSAGIDVDLSGLTYFENKETRVFRTWDLERNASVSANAHVLETLHLIPSYPDFDTVRETIILMLLDNLTLNVYWADKWHASPYYATSHTLLALLKEESFLTQTTHHIIDWLVHTQQMDGSWGFFGIGTPEETAYVLTALLHFNRHQSIDPGVLHRGAAYLMREYEKPKLNCPDLWIAKCLYGPYDIVRSAVQAALILYLTDFG